MWWWLALACTPREGPVATVPGGPDSEADSGEIAWPSQWSADTGAAEAPLPEVALVEEALQEFLDLAWRWDPVPALALYRELMSARHEDCVDYDEVTSGGATYFQWSGKGLCPHPESNSFVGMSWGLTAEEAEVGDLPTWPAALGSYLGRQPLFTGQGAQGQANLLTPAGARFDFSGQLMDVEAVLAGEGSLLRVREVSGIVRSSEGCEAVGEWTCEVGGVDVLLALVETDKGSRRVDLTGSAGPLPESGLTVSTTALVVRALGEQDMAEACTLEPSGSFRVRTASGAWLEVAFQGESLGEACDGCGLASVEGEELGRVCLDLEGILAGPEEGAG